MGAFIPTAKVGALWDGWSAEARRATAKSDTHHALNGRDGFREGLNPSLGYDFIGTRITRGIHAFISRQHLTPCRVKICASFHLDTVSRNILW
jgi:hypothetical protein